MTSPTKFYLICLFSLSACTTYPLISTEDTISKKVTARWNALIKQQWASAYQHETNGYRESHTLEQYKAKFGKALYWQQAEVLNVKLNESESKATVSVSILYEMTLPMLGLQKSNAYLTETWLLDDGAWMHYTN